MVGTRSARLSLSDGPLDVDVFVCVARGCPGLADPVNDASFVWKIAQRRSDGRLLIICPFCGHVNLLFGGGKGAPGA